jgi:hypothetical protein
MDIPQKKVSLLMRMENLSEYSLTQKLFTLKVYTFLERHRRLPLLFLLWLLLPLLFQLMAIKHLLGLQEQIAKTLL